MFILASGGAFRVVLWLLSSSGSSTVDGQSYVCTWVFWVLLFRLNERAEMHFADLLGQLAELILGPQGSCMIGPSMKMLSTLFPEDILPRPHGTF